MQFVDVMGPPGSGKSTLCDALWSPHELPIDNRPPPAAWHDFINEITRLFHLIKPHPTFGAAVRMNNRSIRKMSTVARDNRQWREYGEVNITPRPYIQTGFAQRGLGFGWRLNDMGISIDELRHYFRLMPVSIGVAVTRCRPEIVEHRNRGRLLVKETAHENRAFMVPLMQPAIELALEVLRDRGVHVIEIDTEWSIESSRQSLIDFSRSPPCYASKTGLDIEVEVLSQPPWWKVQ